MARYIIRQTTAWNYGYCGRDYGRWLTLYIQSKQEANAQDIPAEPFDDSDIPQLRIFSMFYLCAHIGVMARVLPPTESRLQSLLRPCCVAHSPNLLVTTLALLLEHLYRRERTRWQVFSDRKAWKKQVDSESRTYDVRPLLFGEFQFSPLFGMYYNRNIFEVGIEMLPDSSFSNSINMPIPADILSLSVGQVLDFIWL
ncbi:uncharacterized protein LACBIDRAFT_315083 [Laccaria bicolor S238N-H82]|uniref:Predicted protein n=1 Tax=Laccaria bicolor (strain S238N-H82 / ATCC MYA-4686) TaxID=486041 RepID=B0DV02_LACBS|nr:uncharacterized protein LACBIDRAFT_310738 [Laccaria bicolor S238N-H82]XP_001889469.1 uncharacterized protein LACBIDRAFT_315083 [Laccaria bicolor S238N-H82]EDQ99926.1 predicted protein [Laccaria bicolor S238N-H82]EDR01704.1 predicted protein [Laccaria bicolor S238N-H82]|eukprot:XP_001887780.1 predicted protein [Laccaria bicolor S238N-H82]